MDNTLMVAGNVTGVMTQVFESMKKVTGIDLNDIVKAKGYEAQVTKNVNLTTNGTPIITSGDEKVVPASAPEQE